MFSFGEFSEVQIGHGNYSIWELSLFVILGCLGGLIGMYLLIITIIITVYVMI